MGNVEHQMFHCTGKICPGGNIGPIHVTNHVRQVPQIKSFIWRSKWWFTADYYICSNYCKLCLLKIFHMWFHISFQNSFKASFHIYAELLSPPPPPPQLLNHPPNPREGIPFLVNYERRLHPKEVPFMSQMYIKG